MISKTSIDSIFDTFSQLNPSPTTELYYKDHFTLLIAVLLSAQSTDKAVNIVTKVLFETYDTPQKILNLGLDRLKLQIKTIGLFNTKAANIISLCDKIINVYNGKIPNKFEDLIKLPGVGRKTADVILATAFNQKRIAVDTHIFRVSHRIGLSDAKTRDKVSDDLVKVIPEKWQNNAHHWLVLHGRYVCIARGPKCDICPIQKHCQYHLNLCSNSLLSAKTKKDKCHTK